MEKLCRKFRLKDIPSKLAEKYPNKLQSKLRQFYFYQIEHAYQIRIWQNDLVFRNKIYSKTKAKCLEKYVEETLGENLDNAKLSMKDVNAALRRFNIEKLHSRENKFLTYNYNKLIRKAVNKSYEEVIHLKEIQDEIEGIENNTNKQFIKSIKNIIIRTKWEVSTLKRISNFIFFGKNVKRVLPRNVAKIYAECIAAEKDKNYSLHFENIAKLGNEASKTTFFNFFCRKARKKDTQLFYDLFKKAYDEKLRLSSTIFSDKFKKKIEDKVETDKLFSPIIGFKVWS